jgi:hypothetical protein
MQKGCISWMIESSAVNVPQIPVREGFLYLTATDQDYQGDLPGLQPLSIAFAKVAQDLSEISSMLRGRGLALASRPPSSGLLRVPEGPALISSIVIRLNSVRGTIKLLNINKS